MNIFELYKLRYNLSKYLIYDDENYLTLVDNFVYWKLLILVIFAIIILVILINYNEINLISIFFIICSCLFIYYSYNIEINLNNIKNNELLINYSNYYKLVNAIFIENFNNLPNSNKLINNLVNKKILPASTSGTSETTPAPIKLEYMEININEKIPAELLSNATFNDFYENLIIMLNKIIINIKFNENILNNEFINFFTTNIVNKDILKYLDISDNNSSFKNIKNLYFLKINENNKIHKFLNDKYNTYKEISFFSEKSNLFKINEIIMQLNTKYYIINLDILDKCISENIVENNDISFYLKKIYDDIIKNFNDNYNTNIKNFKLLSDNNVLNNKNFKLKINKLIKEFNNNFFKILLIFIYFFIVILHVFYTKIITPSYYISFIFYILLFLLFIIIFYSSIYSKII
jgi:hypothetical protein